jgi:hypothetical protein
MSRPQFPGPVVLEAKLAESGYTVSIANRAVLGRFNGRYFMRSGNTRLTLPAGDTSLDELISRWNDFRQHAVAGHFAPMPVHQAAE